MLTADNQGNVRAIEKVVWSCTVGFGRYDSQWVEQI